MWPLALDLTRDECRGILRRSELQSYSSVVNTFRAQGGLSETKAKILTELREIFHISLDRHRAEARRVANDERLSTVADVMAGPNTRQEWIMEGRRTFPFLPRSAPCTGLSVIVNDAIDTANALNAKLEMPCDTARDVPKYTDDNKATVKVLTEDPIKEYEKEFANQPKVVVNNHQKATKTPAKKRISPSGNSTNLRIQQLYNRHTKTQLIQNRKTHPKRTTLVKATKSSPQRSRKTKMDLQTTTTTTTSTPSTLQTIKKTPKILKTDKAKKPSVTKVQKLSANSIIVLPPPQQQQTEQLPQDKNENLNQMWTPAAPHSSSSSSVNTFSTNNANEIGGGGAADDLRPPPVQIVFTSQIEPVGGDTSSNYHQPNDTDTSILKNNLITESTPITWISKPSEATLNNQQQQQQHRTKKMILLPSTSMVGKTLSTITPINQLPSVDNTIIGNTNNQALKTNIRRKAIGGSGGNIVQELIVDSNILNGVNYVTNTVPSTTTTTKLSPNAPTIIDNQLIVPARSTYTITSSTAQNIQQQHQQPAIIAVSQNQQLSSSSSSSTTTIVTNKNTIAKITKPILFAKTISGNTITATGGANSKNLQGLIPIVGTQPIQLKTLQSRGNVKIISSGGKVILKTTNDDGTSSSSSSSSSNIQRLLKGVVNQGPFQKMQLLPASNASGGKTNLVFVQRSPMSTTATPTSISASSLSAVNSDSGHIKTFVNHITSVSGEKIAIYPGLSTKIDGGPTMAEKLASGNLLSGLLTAGKAATATSATSTIINEDTPVDILPSDGIYDPSAAEPTQSAIIIQSPPPLPQSSSQSSGSIDIINKQILKSPIKFKTGTTLHTINRSVIGGISSSSITTTTAATSIVQNYDVRKRKPITIKTSPTTLAASTFDNNNKRARMETYVLDANVHIKTNNAPLAIAAAISPSPGQVINTTDWEKELDHANSMKAATSSSSSPSIIATTINADSETTKTIPDITNETIIDELIEEDPTTIDEMVTESIVDEQVIECDGTSYITQI